jgi:hypothetical protein
MSSRRAPRRVSGSTRGLVSKLPLSVVSGLLHRHFGFSRRDLHASAATAGVRWVATPSNVGGEM